MIKNFRDGIENNVQEQIKRTSLRCISRGQPKQKQTFETENKTKPVTINLKKANTVHEGKVNKTGASFIISKRNLYISQGTFL